MHYIRFLVAFACLAAGAIVGALNRQSVAVDLGVASVPSTLGVVLILALLIGVAAGGLAVTVSLVLPLRRRLARVEHQRAAPVPSPEA